ncbi:Keratin, type I cytoskeletal 16 [Triplophysa tibetana]|uniref:Keratin, type I cytoskeletal 16 n=1 Tax=Triplophysa tibetana TaxID=1572043 RepID=A0A5A9NH94_9TELE|nr:Keratin, type I cytoskeletal 16 [Triplophysa tibetana]
MLYKHTQVLLTRISAKPQAKKDHVNVHFSSSHCIIMSVRRSSKSVSSLVSFGSRRRISTSSGVVMNGFESSGFGYGNLGGYDIFSKSVTSGYETPLFGNEKQTMMNLNDRLASYLEKVSSMEKANSKLELQISTFYENRSPMQRKDMSSYFKTISDLRTQNIIYLMHNLCPEKIFSRFVENSELRLKLDSTGMAAADFQIKYETEKNLRMIVEADLPRLRGVMGEIKMSITDLETQNTGLKEELLYLKKTHEEVNPPFHYFISTVIHLSHNQFTQWFPSSFKQDLHVLRAKQSGSVNVEIDSASHSDLDKMLEEMRSQYETLVEKNRREVEQWYQTKKQQLEQSLVEVRERYSAKLHQLQIYIDNLQEKQQRLNTNIQEQSTEYKLLLDIRMRLEIEIAEYRRLLGGELQTYEKATSTHLVHESSQTAETVSDRSVTSTSKTSMIKTETVTSTETKEEITEEVEDVHNPHLQRRVKVIVEEIVDGQVVSTSVDEKVQEIN